MASNEIDKNRLQELGGSDFEIADGQENIRGWKVKDTSGRKLGEVDELIFDEPSRKVRYMVLDLDDNELDLEDRKVLIPIGMAQLHENDNEVILRNVTVEQLMVLPKYDEDNLSSDVETQTRTVFVISGTTNTDADFYSHENFNDNTLYRNRQQSR